MTDFPLAAHRPPGSRVRGRLNQFYHWVGLLWQKRKPFLLVDHCELQRAGGVHAGLEQVSALNASSGPPGLLSEAASELRGDRTADTATLEQEVLQARVCG